MRPISIVLIIHHGVCLILTAFPVKLILYSKLIINWSIGPTGCCAENCLRTVRPLLRQAWMKMGSRQYLWLAIPIRKISLLTYPFSIFLVKGISMLKFTVLIKPVIWN